VSSPRIDVVVVGAGPAGLAISACLGARGVEHAVLERGAVAESWRSRRWDSLRLLTPSSLTRLPGDPTSPSERFDTAGDLVARLERYRGVNATPVLTGVTVRSVRRERAGYAVDTDQGRWCARAVVVATGIAHRPKVPAVAEAIPRSIRQLTALSYRNPEGVSQGPTLVVGASASGVQIADELVRSGREVVLATGSHTRLPRTYRGRDIYLWQADMGVLDAGPHEVADLDRARRVPSPQLSGRDDGTLDLNTLHRAGIEIVGRLVGTADGRAQLSGSLSQVTVSADLKARRLLRGIDEYVDARGLGPRVGPPEPLPDVNLPTPPTALPWQRFENVVWATGYRPSYPWLDTALLDRWGRLRHDGGVLPTPGMYALGLPFQRRRSSSLIYGIGADAAELTDHVVAGLVQRHRVA
jgi:putative flavoprotein involved in K+ transport